MFYSCLLAACLPRSSLNLLDGSLLAAEAPRGGTDKGDTEDSDEDDLIGRSNERAAMRQCAVDAPADDQWRWV
jgi:hypothetical protein